MRPLPDRLLDDFGPQPMPVFDRILVPSDGSPSSQSAVALAVRLAAAFAAALRVVVVVEHETNGAGSASAEAAAETLREAAARAAGEGVAAEIGVLTGDVVEELLVDVASWRADLIVVGSHARGETFLPALGSKTGELLRKATVPVLVVR